MRTQATHAQRFVAWAAAHPFQQAENLAVPVGAHSLSASRCTDKEDGVTRA